MKRLILIWGLLLSIVSLVSATKKQSAPIIIFLLCVFTFTLFAEDGSWLRVVSEETDEPLPFSVVELDNGKFITTDADGIINLAIIEPGLKPTYVTSFNHERKMLSTGSYNLTDTTQIRLKPSCVSLNEIKVRPLKKDKDIFIGKYASLSSEFVDTKIIKHDSVKLRYFHGIRINAKKNKLNTLKAFGVNVVPSDTMPEKFIFKISIYDVSGEKPEDPKDIPQPVYDPIYVLMDKDSITHQGFRFEFPEPLDLPKKAVLMVDSPSYYTTLKKGQAIDLVSSFTGNFFLYGNPYYLSPRNFLGFRYRYSPFFWEYTQYSLPKK